MEVDKDEYPLANITNFGEYMDLKSPEKSIKKNKTKQGDESIKWEVPIKKKYRSYKSEDKALFFYFVYEEQLSIRTGQNWYNKGVEGLE